MSKAEVYFSSNSKNKITREGNDFRLWIKDRYYNNRLNPLPIPYITLVDLFSTQLRAAIFDNTDSEIGYEEEVSKDSNSDIFAIYKQLLGLSNEYSYIFNIRIKVLKVDMTNTQIDISIYYGKINPKTRHYFKHKPQFIQPEYIHLSNNEIVELSNNIRSNLIQN